MVSRRRRPPPLGYNGQAVIRRRFAFPALAVPLALPLAAGLLAYPDVARNGFVLDDYHFVVENLTIRSLNPLPRLLHATVTDGGAFYRPVGLTSFAVDYAVFGLSPAAFHLSSVLAHLAVTALVALLASPLAGREGAV